MKVTFLDANVLIAATSTDSPHALAASQVILDPNREFVGNDFLILETLPKKAFHGFKMATAFLQDFFANGCRLWIETDADLLRDAIDEATRNDLSAIDSIHIVAAAAAKADELITLEKRTKPIYRSRLVKVKHLCDV